MEEEKKKNILEYFSIEAGIIVLIAVIIIGILFYMGVIPFNPSAKKTQLSNTTPTQINVNSPVVECPVTGTLCPNAEIIKSPASNYSTLAWKIPKDSQVFAAFDGTLRQQIIPLTASSSAAVYVAIITSSNGKYQAHYIIPSFKLSEKIEKTVLSEKKVKAKDVIFPNNETIILFQDQTTNLSFYISSSASDSAPINIDPKKLGKIVLP